MVGAPAPNWNDVVCEASPPLPKLNDDGADVAPPVANGFLMVPSEPPAEKVKEEPPPDPKIDPVAAAWLAGGCDAAGWLPKLKIGLGVAAGAEPKRLVLGASA